MSKVTMLVVALLLLSGCAHTTPVGPAECPTPRTAPAWAMAQPPGFASMPEALTDVEQLQTAAQNNLNHRKTHDMLLNLQQWAREVMSK